MQCEGFARPNYIAAFVTAYFSRPPGLRLLAVEKTPHHLGVEKQSVLFYGCAHHDNPFTPPVLFGFVCVSARLKPSLDLWQPEHSL